MDYDVYQFEIDLLEPSVRASKDKLNSIISDDFIEFGSSGNIYTKKDILNSVPNEPAFQYKMMDYKERELSQSLILVTYQITIDNVSSLRSSIWRFNNKNWEIIFHQGTLCNI